MSLRNRCYGNSINPKRENALIDMEKDLKEPMGRCTYLSDMEVILRCVEQCYLALFFCKAAPKSYGDLMDVENDASGKWRAENGILWRRR